MPPRIFPRSQRAPGASPRTEVTAGGDSVQIVEVSPRVTHGFVSFKPQLEANITVTSDEPDVDTVMIIHEVVELAKSIMGDLDAKLAGKGCGGMIINVGTGNTGGAGGAGTGGTGGAGTGGAGTGGGTGTGGGGAEGHGGGTGGTGGTGTGGTGTGGQGGAGGGTTVNNVTVVYTPCGT